MQNLKRNTFNYIAEAYKKTRLINTVKKKFKPLVRFTNKFCFLSRNVKQLLKKFLWLLYRVSKLKKQKSAQTFLWLEKPAFVVSEKKKFTHIQGAVRGQLLYWLQYCKML